MRKVYIPLKDDEREALVDLALDKRRRPQDQGALLIREALESLGYIGKEKANAQIGSASAS